MSSHRLSALRTCCSIVQPSLCTTSTCPIVHRSVPITTSSSRLARSNTNSCPTVAENHSAIHSLHAAEQQAHCRPTHHHRSMTSGPQSHSPDATPASPDQLYNRYAANQADITCQSLSHAAPPSSASIRSALRRLLRLVSATHQGQHQQLHAQRQEIQAKAIQMRIAAAHRKDENQPEPEAFKLARMRHLHSEWSRFIVAEFRRLGKSCQPRHLDLVSNYSLLLESNLRHSFHLYESGWSSANRSLVAGAGEATIGFGAHSLAVDSVARRVGLQLTEKQLADRKEAQRDTKAQDYSERCAVRIGGQEE